MIQFKNVKTFLSLFVALVFIITGCSHSVTSDRKSGEYQPRYPADRNISSIDSVEDLSLPWAYDPGPDTAPGTMGRELVDLVAEQPNMPGISMEITGEQKFRPAFGPTLWRMIQKPNSIKILFIGQDGTHVAEAAGRTATAGFGGRAQDLAAYFGVHTGAAFINTFAFTIRGQYSAFQAPFVSNENGVDKINVGSIVDNGTWMMAQDQNSPMVKWRNSLIDWIIRNNKDSLKMIVLFGGSAQDSIGTFIESRGGKVGAKYNEITLKEKNIRVPLFNIESAGSNKVFPVPVDRQGLDLYPKLVGRKLDYSKPEDQKAALDSLKNSTSKALSEMVFVNGGLENSGIIHPAQINGYDLGKVEVDGRKTLSLRGLKLSDGSEIQNDVLIAECPHPTALSLLTPPEASSRIQASLKQIEPYVKNGWMIQPDPGMKNEFAEKKPYRYSRTDIPIAYYDFGTPKNRMVSKSDASRMTGKPNIVVLGTRDKAQFDMRLLANAAISEPSEEIDEKELFSARPRNKERYEYDRGPGSKMAQLMKQNLDLATIGKLKPGCQLKAGVVKKPSEKIEDVADVDCFNIKTHPIDVADHGHYRGTFKNPKVIILADPVGHDEILTSRALTGTRGQYLHGLMADYGVSDQYLVLRTVPFGMDGASDQEWKTVLSQTEKYRSALFEEIFKNGKPALVIADGAYASAEIDRLVPDRVPVVKIERSANEMGFDNGLGLAEAISQINKSAVFDKVVKEPRMANIPRTHLGFFSRVWEGTSGTRVFNTKTPAANGIAFAIVVPNWAAKQKIVFQTKNEREAVETLKNTLQRNKLDTMKQKRNNFKKSPDSDDEARYIHPYLEKLMGAAA